MPTSFVHREHTPGDPAFLRDERKFLNRQWASLHVMERQRDDLVREIEQARRLASEAGIPSASDLDRGEHKLLAVIGIGNRAHGDDAAGLEVARRLRLAHPPGVVLREEGGAPASLVEAWSGADEALVVDAISSGSPPGTIHRVEVNGEPLPADVFRPSGHAAGLAEAVELARELDRLPGRLVVYGIEDERFEAGDRLSTSVQRAVAQLVMDLYNELSGAS
jgi:hydrogenase maturation protease